MKNDRKMHFGKRSEGKKITSEGHVLIIPKRHVASFFDLTEEEVLGIWRLVKEVKDLLDGRFHPICRRRGEVKHGSE